MKNTAAAKKAAQPPLEKDDEVSGKRTNVPAELQQRANALLNANNVDTAELKKIVHLLVSFDAALLFPISLFLISILEQFWVQCHWRHACHWGDIQESD